MTRSKRRTRSSSSSLGGDNEETESERKEGESGGGDPSSKEDIKAEPREVSGAPPCKKAKSSPERNEEDEAEDPPRASSPLKHEREEIKTEESVSSDSSEKEKKVDTAESSSPPPTESTSSPNGEDIPPPPLTEDPSPPTRSPELDRLWNSVREDPMDFSSWTSLLQHADAQGSLEEGRKAYDAFLDRFPYCYGYWKKYADLEKRNGESSSPERVIGVFERGIESIPLSGDLWIHYLNHMRKNSTMKPEEGEGNATNEDSIRKLYERAVGSCGREWRSDKLWDHYVKWETSLGHFESVLRLYDRILRNPTQGLTHQFEMFRDFVKEHRPKEILGAREFLSLRKEVLASLASEGDVKKEDKPESEPAPDGESTEEEDIAMKEKIIFSRKGVYKATESFVQERWKFEDNIKRPYFHMKPLERGQLKNWVEYLDYEIAQVADKAKQREKNEDEAVDEKEESRLALVNDSRVEVLFERCLIACALYEEFWFKYIDWLKSRKGEDLRDKIRDVYQRACEHHLRDPSKVDIHLRRAEFEEKAGNTSLASEIFQKLESQHPEVLGLSLKRINLERRAGNHEKVRTLFTASIQKRSGKLRTEMAVKYARYLRLVHEEADEALSVLRENLPHDEKNPKPYLQILDIHLHAQPPLDLRKIQALFEEAITKMGPRDKLLFSQRRIEFLEDFGSDVHESERAKKHHAQLQKKLRESSEGGGISSVNSGSNGNISSGLQDAKKEASSSSNSASYNAHHNSQYQTYGARLSSNYNYNNGSSSSSGAYGSYYQAYSSGGSNYAGY
eukprot:TRINITY_DN602_c0_g1_i1.p1 TRINITY_DN602_c0_g1~~TRINITY_DN602_c0_g1_i1.p1  ORF type:complete len:805 (+),score=267.33 TRINITY_DN602_c0_g1_i1:46-2415(+)